MKKFLTFLIFLFSVSFSQTYVCSETIKGVELEKKTYEKVDDYMYLKTLNTGENQNFKIVNETESFVVLVQSFTFPSIFVTIIDKTNNTFVEDLDLINSYSFFFNGIEKVNKRLGGRKIMDTVFSSQVQFT